MTLIDYFALCLFGLLWFAFAWITGQGRIFARTSLTQAMAERRRLWIINSLGRDLKMIDTQILSGLQSGTAFFASTSILAIGGCFALLGQTEQVDTVLRDLPFVMPGGRTTFELKVFVLAAILGYSFFKFGWSYRLFNYCTILFGALPMADEARRDPQAAARAAELTIRMNIIAAGHFNSGLRALFMSVGYLGWFASPYLFMATSVIVFIVLLRRQFFSEARLALIESPSSSP
ncbi:MAG: DUF599 family protein [Rhizobium sp.]|nr:DUF599 family protein [Rhizobium sp.]